MTKTEALIHAHFSEKYGVNLNSRFNKLNEEFKELNDAYEIYLGATDPADRKIKCEHLEEELSDMVTVASHIASILGTDLETLLLNAVVKSKVREVEPNYKRL